MLLADSHLLVEFIASIGRLRERDGHWQNRRAFTRTHTHTNTHNFIDEKAHDYAKRATSEIVPTNIYTFDNRLNNFCHHTKYNKKNSLCRALSGKTEIKKEKQMIIQNVEDGKKAI